MTDLDVYLAYPRHVARVSALKAIAKAIRDLSVTVGESQARQTIYEATKAFAASPAGSKGQFTPYPATWFNAGRYLDDQVEWWAGEEMPEPGIFRASPDDEVWDGTGYVKRSEYERRPM